MTLRNPRTLLGVRNLVPLCLLALITAPIPALIPAAHAQNQLWITQFGTFGDDRATAVAPDGTGGVMVAGWTTGNFGGPGGSIDAFLARYDSAGNQLWIRQFGTSATDRAFAAAPDGAGGVMVAGRTDGSLGGPHAGGNRPDAWLARFDGSGNQLWIRQFGSSEYDIAQALAPDGAGGVMVAGQTSGDLGAPIPDLGPFLARYDESGNRLWIRQFGGGAGGYVVTLSPDGSGGVMVAGNTWGSMGGPSAGVQDVFLARYDNAGNQLWIRQFGTSSGDYASGLAPDGAGGVIVAGYTEGSLGGLSAGREDIFLIRYDGAGNQLWIRQFGTSSGDGAFALSSDGSGGVIVAGGTHGSLGGQHAGGMDIFLAGFDGAGNQTWIHQFGTSSSDYASALAPDGAGGVMVAGYTLSSLGGPNAGGFDAWIAHYDASGSQTWITQFGTNNNDAVAALAPDGAGGVMVAGSTHGSLGGPNAGQGDVFLARYSTGVCYADCDPNGVLDIFDFLCFQNSFVLSEPYACDCDPDPVCDIFDFLCFQNAFVGGCP